MPSSQVRKTYTRDQFEELRIDSAKKMAADSDLQETALDVLVRGDRHNWIHQSTWFGEPVLQLPQDLLALQEIIFKTRPRYIVEVGVAWGGSLLFYSTLMEALGGERIIGIDIYIPDDLKERIGSFGRLSDRITWIHGSSVEKDTIDQVKAIIGDSRETLVILDSDHSHDHVRKELEIYAAFVGVGYYLICSDTVVDDIPNQDHRPRPWGPGNNPKTALEQFLSGNDQFEVDSALENKLLLSCQPGGYLRRR